MHPRHQGQRDGGQRDWSGAYKLSIEGERKRLHSPWDWRWERQRIVMYFRDLINGYTYNGGTWYGYQKKKKVIRQIPLWTKNSMTQQSWLLTVRYISPNFVCWVNINVLLIVFYCYYKLPQAWWHNINTDLSFSFRSQKSKMGLDGLKWRCQEALGCDLFSYSFQLLEATPNSSTNSQRLLSQHCLASSHAAISLLLFYAFFFLF